jgi:hypothetical protein
MLSGEGRRQSDDTCSRGLLNACFGVGDVFSSHDSMGWALRVLIGHCFTPTSPKPQVGQARMESKPGIFTSIYTGI